MNDLGTRPELLWIGVELLDVDHRYQRTLESRRSQKLIERIAESFRWSAFQAILATRVDRRFLVIDGQHRVEAAKRRGIREVPAVVVDAPGLAEQAMAFVRANTDRVAVNNFALYHARLAAGDPDAAAIGSLCEAAGISIPKYPIPADKLRPGQTLALATIGALPRRYGEAVALRTLRAVAAAYGRQPGGLRAPLFSAVAALIAAAPVEEHEARANAIIAILAARDPAQLELRALERKRRVGGTVVAALVFLIRTELERLRVASAIEGSFIKPPTREQLMGRR